MKNFINKNKAIVSSLLAVSLLASCGGGSNSSTSSGNTSSGGSSVNSPDPYTYEKQSTDGLMQFYSSNSELDFFLNDYMERHLRYNENAIGALQLGGGNSIWKEWESMAVMFMNTDSIGYDPKSSIKSWAETITQDEFGYIWMDNGTNSSSWGQSWEFPSSSHSAGYNHTYDFNNTTNGFKGYSNTGVNATSRSTNLSVIGNSMKTVTFETTDSANALLCEAFFSPFLELRLNIIDSDALATSQVEDIKIYWKTQTGDMYGADKMVSYKNFASTKYDKFPATAKVVFPMYAHENWGTDYTKIVDMKIEIQFKDSFNGEVAIDDLDFSFDARQINNNGVFITAVTNYFKYTQDVEFLQSMIQKLRNAMNFYQVYCNGTNGLVDTTNFVGHDGSTNELYMNDKSSKLGIGKGIGDGYWDILSYPQVSSYINNLYYQSLQDMQYIEKVAKEAGIVTSKSSTMTADMATAVEYNYTEQSYAELIEKTYEKYNNEFWDAGKGRYVLGVNADGDTVDYGFTLYNQEAIIYGLSDSAKSKSIMEWINGERVVAGDDSQSEDIYYYDFAPRWTTKSNENQFWWRFDGKNGLYYKWGNQVQNGGTTAHQVYYDLGAEMTTNGVEDTFSKLLDVKAWYEDVLDNGGEGYSFYEDYYLGMGNTYKLQGRNGAGAIGLDSEFLEAAILYTSIPDFFFGLNSNGLNTLTVAPNLPSSLDYWKMENLSFKNLVYDLSIGENFVQINNVQGDASNLKVSVELNKPEGEFVVKQHTTVLTENKDYVVVGNKIIITVPFKNGRIQVL